MLSKATLSASLLRSAIAFAPLFSASIIYRNDHPSLLICTRFFLSFSLAAAVGSLGLGAYVYSLNISSSSASSMSQRAEIISYIFRQMSTRWWILSGLVLSAILASMGALMYSPYQVFFLVATIFIAPGLLISTQYFLSIGSRRLFLLHTLLQSFVLISFLPFVGPLQALPFVWVVPLGLIFLGIKKYITNSCLQDCLQRSFVDNANPCCQHSASAKYTLYTGKAKPTIPLSTRLKCFVDSFFPLAYTSIILLFLERLQLNSSEVYQLLFYNYSRVSEAIVSLFVTYCTLSVSKKLFKLLDIISGLENRSPSDANRSLVEILTLVLPIFSAFVFCLCIGYVLNYLLLGSFSILLASFDVLISSLKLAGIFLSLYMLTRLPTLALISQFLSLALVSLGAIFAPGFAIFFLLVAVSLGLSSLFPLVVFFFRSRLSTSA